MRASSTAVCATSPLMPTRSMQVFIQAYFASQVKITDHNGRVWIGNLINNPFEFDSPRRAAPAIAPMPRGESQTITLEFEGVANV